MSLTHHLDRHNTTPEAEKAMRRHSMMIGLVCENMLAGRPGLSGLEQFLESEAEDD